LKYYKKIGNFGYCDEVPPFDPVYATNSPFAKRVITESWRANWLANYMKAFFMWDAEADYETVFEDAGSAFYGAAWPAMKRYKTLLGEIYASANDHFCYGSRLGQLGKCLEYPLAERDLARALDEAERAAGRDAGLLKKIRAEREYFELSFIEGHRQYRESRKRAQVAAGERTGPVAVDGRTDEPDWRYADFGGDFSIGGAPVPPEAGTHVRLLYDADAVYLQALALEPPAAKRARRDGARPPDPALEFWIGNPALDAATQMVCLAVDSDGGWSDSRGQGPGAMDEAFQSGAQVAVADAPAGWAAELRIPAAALGRKPAAGETWKLNVVRRRPAADGKATISSWSDGGPHGPRSWRQVSFGNHPIVKNGDFADWLQPDPKTGPGAFTNGLVPAEWHSKGTLARMEGESASGRYFLRGNGFVFQYLVGLQGLVPTYGTPRIYQGKLRVSAKARGKGKVSFQIKEVNGDSGGNHAGEVDSPDWRPIEWVYDARHNSTGLLLLYVFSNSAELDLDDIAVTYESDPGALP